MSAFADGSCRAAFLCTKAALGTVGKARSSAHEPPWLGQSAKADFANFQRRIHSLQARGWQLPDQIRNGHYPLTQLNFRLSGRAFP
jgi:hypothetical protein